VLQDILSEREEMYYELVSQFKTLPSLHNSIKIQRLDSLPKKHKIIYFWLCIVPLMFLVWLARDKLFERINLIMYKFYHNSAINCGRSIWKYIYYTYSLVIRQYVVVSIINSLFIQPVIRFEKDSCINSLVNKFVVTNKLIIVHEQLV